MSKKVNKKELRKAASKGRYGDTLLAHVNKKEAKNRSGTNPITGLPEFYSDSANEHSRETTGRNMADHSRPGDSRGTASGSLSGAHLAGNTTPVQQAAPPQAGGVVAADKMIEDKYLNSPTENPTGKATDRDYWNSVGHIGNAYKDYKDLGNSTLDNIGNFLAGIASVGEMDPTRQSLFDADDTASWGVDPLGLAMTGAGMVTGLPFGTLYKGAKMATGYPGPQIAVDGKQYLDYGMPSSPIAQGGSVYANGSQPGGFFGGPGKAAPSNLGKGNGASGPVSALALAAANPGMAPTTSTPTPGDTTTPPATDPQATGPWTYHPYTDDYATYGERPEHQYFNYNMAEGGQVQKPQYKSFGGFIKKLAKTVGPAILGAGASALTGSDILGGLTAGATSKLLGNSWLTAGLTGLGTGALSSITGLSGDQPGPFAGLLGGGPSDYMAGLVPGADGGGGSGVLDFIKNNPTAIGAAGLMGLSALAGHHKQPQPSGEEASSSANDPAYAAQIQKGGWDWNRKPTDTSKVNWYQYGQMPEWDFFSDENSFTPKAHGGPVAGKPALGGAMEPAGGALSTHGGAAQGPGGGQDDKIPVYLSAKEYVVPADVVSDLGDGNPDEGAKKLNKLRDNVRHSKGRKGFPPKAKTKVEQYL